MAAFGMPGGFEWMIILGMLVLFAGGPALIGFVLGFITGKNSGQASDAQGSQSSSGQSSYTGPAPVGAAPAAVEMSAAATVGDGAEPPDSVSTGGHAND